MVFFQAQIKFKTCASKPFIQETSSEMKLKFPAVLISVNPVRSEVQREVLRNLRFDQGAFRSPGSDPAE